MSRGALDEAHLLTYLLLPTTSTQGALTVDVGGAGAVPGAGKALCPLGEPKEEGRGREGDLHRCLLGVWGELDGEVR